jgi:hypothetical protein
MANRVFFTFNQDVIDFQGKHRPEPLADEVRPGGSRLLCCIDLGEGQEAGVHINPINGHDGRTKWAGPNPLEYVCVTFSQSGETTTLGKGSLESCSPSSAASARVYVLAGPTISSSTKYLTVTVSPSQ